MGVLARILAEPGRPGAHGETILSGSPHLKAHADATSAK